MHLSILYYINIYTSLVNCRQSGTPSVNANAYRARPDIIKGTRNRPHDDSKTDLTEYAGGNTYIHTYMDYLVLFHIHIHCVVFNIFPRSQRYTCPIFLFVSNNYLICKAYGFYFYRVMNFFYHCG